MLKCKTDAKCNRATEVMRAAGMSNVCMYPTKLSVLSKFYPDALVMGKYKPKKGYG